MFVERKKQRREIKIPHGVNHVVKCLASVGGEIFQSTGH